MYTITTNLRDILLSPSRIFSVKLTAGTTELGAEDIADFTIDSSIGNSGQFTIGSTVAKKMSLSLIKSANTPTVWTTQPITLYIGVCNDSTKTASSTNIPYDWIPLGVFYPEPKSVKQTDFSITLDCYDRMTYLEKFQYSSSLTYPISIRSMLTEIATAANITFADISHVPDIQWKVKPEGKTIRQILSEIAEISTANCIIDRLGKFDFIRPSSVSNMALNADNYSTFTIVSDDVCAVTKLIVTKKKTKTVDGKEVDIPDIEYGNSTGSTLTFENDNIETTAELQELYNRLFPFTYYGYELNAQGMPHLDCGDRIQLTTAKNVGYNLTIISHKLAYKGGLTSTFSASVAEEKSSAGSTGTGSLTQAINMLEMNTLKTQKMLANSIEANTAKFNSVEIGKADIDLANIGDGIITNAMIANGAVGNLQIADSSITDAKILKLTANVIKTGTLDASDITVKHLNCASLDVGTINGERIAPGAIDVSHLTTSLETTISDASTNATQALEDSATALGVANGAQTSANGKNKVYYSTTQPSGGTYIAGDTWFDTDDGNKIYQYNGSAWVAVTFGTSALTDNAITSGKLATDVSTDISTAKSTASTALTNVGTAQTTANTALINASTAQTTANGKNKVYYSTAQPTGGTYITGDTWFDTDDGNKIYQFNGSTWAAVTLGTNALTDNAVTSGKLATAVSSDISTAKSTASTALTNVGTAQTTANAALTNASTAQTTADGKNTVFYSTTAPTAKKVNDIWFDTDDGNKVYYWNGTVWTASTFGTNAITNNAIDTNKLTTALNTTINTASTNASTALTNAQTAQTTANGKNTVYYATTAPTGGTYKVNDIWFDTDDGNKLYYYNGTAWTATQFGESALADLSITNAKIADATISSAKIAAIDAGKITSGYISANRINAGTLTANMLAADTITASSTCIADGAISNALIANATIQNAKIATVDASKITTGYLSADRINAGTISAEKMAVDTITAASGVLADACIVSANIADLAVTNAKLADATIQNAKIANLDAAKITTGTISADRIGSKSIAVSKLANDTVQTMVQMSESKLVYTDIDFAIGTNEVGLYDNSADGFVTVSRTVSPAGCPTTSGYCMTMTHTGSGTPAHGGFVQKIQSRANAIFLVKYLMNVPVGYTINVTSNSMGTGYTDTWLTSNVGTGTWQWYVRKVVCGAAGTFSIGGYIYVSGFPTPTVSVPLVWYLGAIYQYDASEKSSALATVQKWCYDNDTTYINGGSIYAGTVSANQINAHTITSNEIASHTITAENIEAKTITANLLAGKIITADYLATDAVTSDKIVANAITGEKISALAITGNKIQANTIKGGNIDTASLVANVGFIEALTSNTVITDTFQAKSALLSDLDSYMKINGGQIEIGSNSSTVKLYIDNDEVTFRQTNQADPLATFTNNGIHANKAAIGSELTIGSFKFFTRSNGNLSIYKV